MKKYLIFISLFIPIYLYSQGICNTNTQARVILYSESNQQSPLFTSLTKHSLSSVKGGFWVTGISNSNAIFKNDLFISKFSDTGKLLFFKHYGNLGSEDGYPISAAAMTDGGIVVSGRSENSKVKSSLVNLSRFDSNGNLLWSRTTQDYNNYSGVDQFRDVYLDTVTQEIYGAGTSTERLGAQFSEILLTKLDTSGNTLFLNYVTIKVGGSMLNCHALRIIPARNSVKKLADYIVPFWGGTGSNQRCGILFIKKDGTVVSAWLGAQNSGIVQISDAVITESGKIIGMGYTNINGGGVDVLLMCLNPITLSLEWQYTYGTTASDYASTIFLESGKLYVTSTSAGISGGNNKRVLLCVDTLGKKLNEWSMVNPSNNKESYEILNASQDDVAILSNNTSVYTGYNNEKNANILLVFASPTSKINCYLNQSDFLKQNPFSYGSETCSFYTFNGGSLQSLNGIEVTAVDFTNIEKCKKQLCVPPINLNLSPYKKCTDSILAVSVKQSDIVTKRLQYLWNDGDTLIVKPFVKPGKYWVTYTNECGSVTDTINIYEISPPIRMDYKDTLVCDEKVDLVFDVSQKGCAIQWMDGNKNPNRTINKFGNYSYSVVNGCGGFTDSFAVLHDSFPKRNWPTVVEVCENSYELVTFPKNGSWKYNWIKGPSVVSNKFTVSPKDTLIIKIQSLCGILIDTIFGKGIYCSPCEIFMPNAFTPFNGDNLNKTIKPVSNCNIINGEWSVYNRWGQVVLDRVPLSQAWDATYMGEPVIPGVYAFIIYGIYDRSDAGVFQISGNITVLE